MKSCIQRSVRIRSRYCQKYLGFTILFRLLNRNISFLYNIMECLLALVRFKQRWNRIFGIKHSSGWLFYYLILLIASTIKLHTFQWKLTTYAILATLCWFNKINLEVGDFFLKIPSSTLMSTNDQSMSALHIMLRTNQSLGKPDSYLISVHHK